jgi:hypothetical protein
VLSPDQKSRIRDLAGKNISAENGMERHFLRVIEGSARPHTPREGEWFEYFKTMLNEQFDSASEDYASATLRPNTSGDDAACTPTHDEPYEDVESPYDYEFNEMLREAREVREEQMEYIDSMARADETGWFYDE